ncbi:MAG: FAD-dependent thymidylate synthase [Spirochaetes bacterium]|nr:FAD-dependent thymidylate synthase [Spirochaetota bacterium]
MKVRLAGFNVDVENINILKKILKKFPDIKKEDIKKIFQLEWTPETISASYARISRDTRSIDILRKEARNEIDKARKSNSMIIFDMGHSSIAEHGVFNIDIIDISRLLAEKLEKSRLVSFTEKSQRYIKIGRDVLYPQEFNEDTVFLKKYKNLVNELFDTYNILHEKIVPYFLEKNPRINIDSKKYRDIINLAKEDARYILPLATLTQLGMTLNARSLEKIIRKLLADNKTESQQLGNQLFKVVEGHAPSLVKYVNPTDYETKTYSSIKQTLSNINESKGIKEVEIININKEVEANVLAALVVKNSNLSYNLAKQNVKSWDKEQKEKVFLQSIKHLNSFDSVLKEYEISDFRYNIVISATAFAQLKRHRMATIIDGEYSPSLGVKIPESIIATGNKNLFKEKIKAIEDLYNEAKQKWGDTADYILSNAHRKNVIIKCNFRELVHITRLRSDKHAQWDIRNISDQIIKQTKAHLPLFGNLLGGKDSYKTNKST